MDKVGLKGFDESISSARSSSAFDKLIASGSSSERAAGLQQLREVLTGLRLRHEAIAQDRVAASESAAVYRDRISALRGQLESKSQELDELKRKFQAEERTASLAKESFERPQWIDVEGEEIRMVLNRSRADLEAEKRSLEERVASLENENRVEIDELRRRLELSTDAISTVAEFRGKVEMPLEQRRLIFGEDGNDEREAGSEEPGASEEQGAYGLESAEVVAPDTRKTRLLDQADRTSEHNNGDGERNGGSTVDRDDTEASSGEYEPQVDRDEEEDGSHESA